MMLEGDLCIVCGGAIPRHHGPGDGIPRSCGYRDCVAEFKRQQDDAHPVEKVKCVLCGKLVKKVGVKDHIRDKHPGS